MAIDYKKVNTRSIEIAKTLTNPLSKSEAFDLIWSIAVEMQTSGILPKVSLNVFRTNISEEISKNCPQVNKDVFKFFRWYPFVASGRSGSWAPQFGEGGIINIPAFDNTYTPAPTATATPSGALTSWKNVTIAPQAPAAKPAPVATPVDEVAQLKSELSEVKEMLAQLLQKQLENA